MATWSEGITTFLMRTQSPNRFGIRFTVAIKKFVLILLASSMLTLAFECFSKAPKRPSKASSQTESAYYFHMNKNMTN